MDKLIVIIPILLFTFAVSFIGYVIGFNEGVEATKEYIADSPKGNDFLCSITCPQNE